MIHLYLALPGLQQTVSGKPQRPLLRSPIALMKSFKLKLAANLLLGVLAGGLSGCATSLIDNRGNPVGNCR